MKTASWLAVAVTFASLPLLAQQTNANGHAGASANGSASMSGGRGTSVDSNGSANARANRSGASAGGAEDMRPVKGELEGKLDAKTSKPGDQVAVKTTEKMKTADGTEIPKGSRIVGHITEVQAHEKEVPVSHLGIAFDRAELKDGRSIPIHSTIQSVSSPPSAMAAAGSDDMVGGGLGGGMVGGGGGAMAGGSASAGRSGGGGLIGGGGGGGLVGGAANTVSPDGGRVGSDVGSTAGGALGATGRVAGNATGAVGGDLNGAAAGTAHATGVPGVMLRDDVTGSASGMLSATNMNVHLDSGTQMVLGVAAAGK